MAHHFAKGDSTFKDPMDRMSGAGVWARDPDSIVVLTPHEEPDCYTVTSILRNLPPMREFVVSWDYPLMQVANDLNPGALRRPQAKNKVCRDKEFMDQFITSAPKARGTIVSEALETGISRATANRYLRKLSEAGVINSRRGHYWLRNGE